MKCSIKISIILSFLCHNAILQAKSSQSSLYKISPGNLTIQYVKKIILYDKKRNKNLQIRVSYPRKKNKYPLIIWSHGAYGSKDYYQPLVTHWVSHGYVVIQATHSDSLSLGFKSPKNVFKDWKNRPLDVKYILNSLNEIEEKSKNLKGKINQKIIGMGGHSFGAHTAQLIGGVQTRVNFATMEHHEDKRIKAILLMSPQGKGAELVEKSWFAMKKPTMTITGTKDNGRKGDSYKWRFDAFKYSPKGNKYLVVIENATHLLGGISGNHIRKRKADKTLLKFPLSYSIAFWDAYLKQNKNAMKFLNSKKTVKRIKLLIK